MCGFVGITGADADRSATERMARTLEHRGPDDSGYYLGPGIALGFRRLSIIDLETGNQPVSNETGGVQAVFNGEIYNYRELRERLRRSGHSFRSEGDAEVIPHLYEELGPELVHELRGMFAFAVWDEARRELFLARDRLGEKPLFYTEQMPGAEFAFASEMKALLAGGVSRDPDPQAIAEYLYHLYVPDPRSAFAAIRKLPPGHTLVRRDGRSEIRRYWTPTFEVAERSDAEHVEGLHERVVDAVRSRMVADVPLGAFLSGGIDSSTIVASMVGAATKPVHTFTITFEGFAHYDESEDARTAAQHFGTEHHELSAAIDPQGLLRAIVQGFDEPFGNATAGLLWALSRETRAHVKVALTGDGADELLFGYPRYRGLELARRYRRLPLSLRSALGGLSRAIPESNRGRHGFRRAREFLAAGTHAPIEAYADWIGYFTPDFLAGALAPPLGQAGSRAADPLIDLFGGQYRDLNDLSRVELQSFLPYNVLAYADRMSMAHGLELRAPFVDHELVDYVATLPPHLKLRRGVTKYALREAFRAELPRATLRKPKRGLNPPLGAWLATSAAPMVRELLAPAVVRRRGILRPDAVERLLAEQNSGRRDRALEVWALLVLETWYRVHVDGSDVPAPESAGDGVVTRDTA